MSFRTVVISNKAHLTYKNDYLVIRKEDDLKMVYIPEIDNLMIDTTMATISSFLLCELIKNKVKIIFCDEKRNPYSELVPYYCSYNTSKKIKIQSEWDKKIKEIIWQEIVRQKISNQARLLSKLNIPEYCKLINYSIEIEPDDSTNREGHAAKVYFNCLFGKNFSREIVNDINAALNYGYSIILSIINKEIVNNGYLTQIGIKHKNEFNYYNLSCDFIEPFRPVIDEFVYYNKERIFNSEYKQEIINILNKKMYYQNKQLYLSDIIKLYVKNILDCLDEKIQKN